MCNLSTTANVTVTMYPPTARTDYKNIEELAVCSCCQRPFNDTDRVPKLLDCKHHFCLACTAGVLGDTSQVCCPHCWKRSDLPLGGAAELPTHGAVLSLARRFAPEPVCAVHSLQAMWCMTCGTRACLACEGTHHTHLLRSPSAARTCLQRDARLIYADLQRLALRQRDFLLRALDATTELKVRLETELAAPAMLLTSAQRDLLEVDDNYGSIPAALAARETLQARHAEALIQCRLDDLIRNTTMLLDFNLMSQAMAGVSVHASPPMSIIDRHDPILFLANYCMAQFYTRTSLAQRARIFDGAVRAIDNMVPDLHVDTPLIAICQRSDSSPGGTSISSTSTGSNAAVGSPPNRILSPYPHFYFHLEVNGTHSGRIVIEVRDDLAPRMAKNFAALTTGEMGIGYRGCHVFQCWDEESLITGDFEHNNGRGGHSIYEETFFMPDDTKLSAVRGAVGMRRSQKRYDSKGLVGSQFRIMLRETQNFSAIFAHVVEGLELVEQLSHSGDSTGKPQSTITISQCGKL